MDDRKSTTVWKMLKKQLADISSRRFTITTARADPDGSYAGMGESLGSININLDIAGQEEHVPVAESKIRRIKEFIILYLSNNQ